MLKQYFCLATVPPPPAEIIIGHDLEKRPLYLVGQHKVFVDRGLQLKSGILKKFLIWVGEPVRRKPPLPLPDVRLQVSLSNIKVC